MAGTGRTPTNYPQPDDQYQADLHPDFEAGVNAGPQRSQELEIDINADQIKQMHTWLPDFTDADLKQIPTVPLGARLQQGATYLDLADPGRRPFTAMGGVVADLDHYYVPKDEISYILWNRLTGVTNPQQLDLSGKGPAAGGGANSGGTSPGGTNSGGTVGPG